MTNPSANSLKTPNNPALVVSHVANRNNRYPGEPVTLYTRVDVVSPAPGLSLRIGLPDGLELNGYQASSNHGSGLPDLVYLDGNRYLIWKLDKGLRPGERYEYRLDATLAPTERDVTLESRAVVMPLPQSGSGEKPAFHAETLAISVSAKGRYLRYLPALYTEQDELMGRWLMLFESFWQPIEQQIDSLYYYFDPKLAPPDLLPWLATWVDLVLDEQWPEEKRRLLLGAMVQLYRRRGTRRGLQDYLEIYTGRKAQITEHGAHNFQLGTANRLGPSVALGRKNVPHTFSVALRLAPARNEALAKERRRKIEAIVESEKPAHTSYTLNIEETE